MTETLSPELQERCVALVRRMAETATEGNISFCCINGRGVVPNVSYAEARAIVALLPKPVDPDLIEARLIAASSVIPVDKLIRQFRIDIRDGMEDQAEIVQATLAAIKRGRQLAEEKR